MPSRPRIEASDVVFMYAPEPRQYDLYSGTVTGWGGRARSREGHALEQFLAQVDEAKRRKMRYCASVDFLVDFAGFIDFCPDRFMDSVCRDLNGKPLTVPWLHDHSHKGHPAYWFCSNSPDYRAYLMDQTERACLAPVDGLHIDDYRGTSACAAWNGGCFCEHCLKGFREYLKRTGKLSASEAEKFNYRDYLLQQGITAERYRQNPWTVPFGAEFQRFQREAMMALVQQVYEKAERIRRKALLRSVNSSASSPEALLVEPLVDYFCGEVDHHAASGKVSVEPLFVYRLVEAFNKRQTATASGWDWAWIAAQEKPGMVRTWIAQAYAFGSVFMVPHNQWCYTPEKGTHWWRGKPEDFAYLYRFVREHRDLFDGYLPLSNTLLEVDEQRFEATKRLALAMLEASVPFAVLYRTPDGRAHTAGNARPSGYRVLSAEQSLSNLPEETQSQLRVESAGSFVVSLRRRAQRGGYPLVIHLLNRNYRVEADGVAPVDVKVRLGGVLLRRLGISPREAAVFSPEGKAITVTLQKNREDVSVEVQSAGLWTVVAIQ
ncbi:MAG: hypothetical protein KatS3mg023_3183 [Armatimonadota bacterium]|nr:MAG: hypothetical protein KatS3mg023_3183 [Armatimonadota bacterium]